MSDSPVVEIDHLRFAWPGERDDVLAIDALAIAPGEAVFVHGPSGCGKSTLLSLLAGVLVGRAGACRLLGRDWRHLAPAARDHWRADHVGYIFQQFNLLPYLSVLDNALLPCRFSDVRKRRAQRHGTPAAAVAALLERLQMPAALWRRPVTQLSVGQQQRVAAARALIGGPELVIADEPTSALDEALRDEFVAVLRQACRDADSALVFVSHDRRLAAQFDRSLSLPSVNVARALP